MLTFCSFFGGLGGRDATLSNAQGLVLALYTGITLARSGDPMGCQESNPGQLHVSTAALAPHPCFLL